MSTVLCTRGTNCRSIGPRPADPGVWLCRTCRTLIAPAALDLRDLYRDLEPLLHPGGTATTGRSGTLARERWPVNPAVVPVRAQIREVLRTWAQRIVEGRGLTPPAVPSIGTLTDLIVTNADWLSSQDDAGTAIDQLDAARRAGRNAGWPNKRATFPIKTDVGPARCIEVIYDYDDPTLPQSMCTGTLVATMRPADDLLPSDLVCTVDPEHTVSSMEWLRWSKRHKAVTLALAEIEAHAENTSRVGA